MREGKLRSFQSFLVKSPFILSKHLRIRSAAISARQVMSLSYLIVAAFVW